MQGYEPSNFQGEDQPYILSKRRRGRTVRRVHWGRIVLALFLLSAAVCIGVVIAAQGGKYVRLKARDFYFVQLGESAVESEALNMAGDIRRAGGAGYLYNDGTYRVLASVYSDKADAQEVAARLSSEGRNAAVFSLGAPDVKYRTDDNAAKNKRIAEALGYPCGLADEVYALSVKLDRSEISESLALLRLSQLLNDVRTRQASATGDDPLSRLLLRQCAELITVLGEAAETATGLKVPVRVKYAQCAISVNIYHYRLEAAKL